EGNATHWGRFTNAGNVQFTPIPGSPLLQVNGGSVYVAANGDRINAIISGTLDLQTGITVGPVNWAGGPRRFANAPGPEGVRAQGFPVRWFVAELNGNIDY